MSSCAASCCTCFPRASSASATSASSPTGAAPLSYRCAAQHSGCSTPDRTRNIHAPGIEPSLALSQLWRADDRRREAHRCPDPTPFPTAASHSCRMKPPSPSRKACLLGRTRPRVSPRQIHPFFPLFPLARYHRFPFLPTLNSQQLSSSPPPTAPAFPDTALPLHSISIGPRPPHPRAASF